MSLQNITIPNELDLYCRSINASEGATTTLDGMVTGPSNDNVIADGVIVDSMVAPGAAIVDTKLATISTAGKVADSATSATITNTPNVILKRSPFGETFSSVFTAQTTMGSAQFRMSNSAASNAVRWAWGFTGTEGGGNSGSNFILWRYDDSGGPTAAFTINRNSGLFFIPQSLSCDQLFTIQDTTSLGAPHWTLQNGVSGGAAAMRFAANLFGTESGGNTGSDFDFISYDDTGIPLEICYTIDRSTGEMLIPNANIVGQGAFTNSSASADIVWQPVSGSNSYTILPGRHQTMCSNLYFGGTGTVVQTICNITATGWLNTCSINGIITINNNPLYQAGNGTCTVVPFTLAYVDNVVTITQGATTTAATSGSSGTITVTVQYDDINNDLNMELVPSSGTAGFMELMSDIEFTVHVNQNLRSLNEGDGTVFTIITYNQYDPPELTDVSRLTSRTFTKKRSNAKPITRIINRPVTVAKKHTYLDDDDFMEVK